ncbi:hypothetical protein [Saccharopolyspora oryzae]|nr:hypothetical protein [Saccharopolyspora oryzae]
MREPLPAPERIRSTMCSTTVAPPPGATSNNGFPRSAWARTAQVVDRGRRTADSSVIRTNTPAAGSGQSR